MKTLSALDPAPDTLRGASVALGNFDGLHAGHRAVIESARRQADTLDAPLGVATFEPAPRRYFQPDAPPFRLMTPLRREIELMRLKVDVCALIPFGAQVAAMTDAGFVHDVLAGTLGLRSVSVGADFRFGRGRMGDADSLRRLGAECGFNVDVVELVADGEEKASSSRIRDMIAAGRMEDAAAALGAPWVVDAVVEPGEKRGRTLGFATANMRLGEIVHPAFGVYAVWLRADPDSRWRQGVASFGRTPTTGLRDPLLEVHVFDWSGDLYGDRLHTAFVKFLRPEAKFPDLQSLVTQMQADAAEARAVLAGSQEPRW